VNRLSGFRCSKVSRSEAAPVGALPEAKLAIQMSRQGEAH
jgi:hypothetical protein